LSLTYYLKEAGKKKITDFFGTSHIPSPITPKNIGVVNPYPESLYKRRLWTLVGTFTDYMMRKKLRDKTVAPDAEIIKEEYLICEYAVELSLRLSKADNSDDIVDEIARSGSEWIDAYRKKPIDSCIEETFMISQLDAVYRAGQFFPLHRLDKAEVEGFKPFLRNIQDWLKGEFSDTEVIILNPTYGHPDICKADADIVIDDTLYEVKTTMYPEKSVSKDMDQLLGYVSLAYYHEQHPISSSPPAIDFKNVGFLFPLSLIHLETSISTFTDSNKQFFLEKILELRNEQEPDSPSIRINVSEIGDRDLSEIVRDILDKGKL
jgi:hypothetical protein